MKAKKIGVIILAVLSILVVSGCGNMATDEAKENVEVSNLETKDKEKSSPISIDDINLDITIKEPDSIGEVYMDGVLTNNSEKVIKFCEVTVLLKDKNEETYLTFANTIMPKEKSSKTETFAPKTRKKDDIEILKYNFTLKGDNGADVYVEYDAKLKEYNWN